MIFPTNACLKKWCQHVDQTIFASFQKPIGNVIQFRCLVWIQFFHDLDHLFFHNDCWAVHQHQIRCAENVAQVSRRWSRKKFIGQKPCFVFKECRQFFINIFLHVSNQRGHFRQFIRNMTFDSDLFDQTPQFFFIRGICINRFLKFQSLRFVYDLLLAVVRVEVSLPISFILWIGEHSTQLSRLLNRLAAFIAPIGVGPIVCSLPRHR